MTLIRLRGFRQDEGETLFLQARRIGRDFDPEGLHEMRSRVRRLRYASELGAALMRNSSEAARLFKNVQEVLGELHDVWVLGLWMARQAETSAGRGRADVAGEARRAHASCEAAGRALHTKFLDLDPPAFLQEALSLAGGAQSVA
jgi:CHAD domain-containing protein